MFAFCLNTLLCGFDGVHILILLIINPHRTDCQHLLVALRVLNCPFLLSSGGSAHLNSDTW